MRYNLQNLTKNGGSDTVRFEINGFPGYDYENAGFKADFPISVTAKLTDANGTVLLNISFETELTVACDRCLSEYKLTVASSEDYTVVFKDEESFDCVLAENNGIELDPLVWEALCLSLPYQKLCSEDCPGIEL
ncbi:MAG: DUF177 domain-containing protein [Clostridia bacterium]|nr:DUF177 domain-containing protein [Clostridia bacterium]MBR2328047.1 DUF177 domain-containing protein [Clostridia bacterium]